MHDTCAPEASHKTNIKKAMDRVRKSDDMTTSESMIKWGLWVQTWGKIIAQVQNDHPQASRGSRRPVSVTVVRNSKTKLLRPTRDVAHLFEAGTFSPLRAGGDHLMSPDARVSYNEVTYDTHICAHIYVYSYICAHICVLA